MRVAEARDDGVSLFAVFDSYNEDLHQIYRALFDKTEEIRPSLGLDPFVNELLFVRALQLDPRWQGTSLEAQAIQTAASTLVTMGLVAANADLGLSVDDWLNLAFVKIAGDVDFLRSRADQEEPNEPVLLHFLLALCGSPLSLGGKLVDSAVIASGQLTPASKEATRCSSSNSTCFSTSFRR